MRIGMLLDQGFPPDVRVANEARTLQEAGHRVHLLALRLDEAAAARETWEGVEIHRLRIGRRFYKKLRPVCLTLPFYFSFFRRALEPFLERESIEALHVHDLPLVSVALEAAEPRGIPVVADLHENYPEAVRTYAYANRFPGKLVVSPERWQRHERRHLPRCARVVVVVEEAAERLGAYGIPPERISVVSNTVRVDEFEGFPREPDIETRYRKLFTLAYVGGIDRHRGLESTVEAFAAIASEDTDSHLLLVGAGSAVASLRARCRSLGLEGRVTFEGWQPFHRVPSYVRGSAVCLIPHLKSGHTDTTIPHKLFHYMLLERPVLATDCRPLKRILERTDAGLCYASGDPTELARRIRELRDAGLRERLGRNGRRAVLEEYNWSRTGETLLALYRSLEARVP